jgi:hypothetical protein
MSTVLQTSSTRSAELDTVSAIPPSPTKPQPAAVDPKPYWGDWVAMVFWTACFGIMALIHLKDLLVGLFR